MIKDQVIPPNFRHGQDKELVPRILVRVVISILALCMIMVSAHVWTDQPKDAMPPQSPVVMEKTLFLKGDMSGAATVLDADGKLIADLSPQEGGFLSGIWRVLQRERTKARVAPDGPIRVTAMENGRMAITDPSTGWSADLMGFGKDNAAAFARLLAQ